MPSVHPRQPERLPRRSRRARSRCALAVLLLGGLLLPTSGAESQVFDPDFRLSFTTDLEAPSGGTVPVECFLDMEPTAAELAGWSFGICHDAALLAPMAVAGTDILETVNNGAPADFVDLASDPVLGVTCGVIFCFTSCATLAPPVTALPILAIEYGVPGAPGSTTQLEYCNTVAIGGNPVPTILVTASAGQRIPILDPGFVEIVEVTFRRGDCDGDGSTGIADAIGLLGLLFSGADAPPCLDACDIHDDGSVNLADAIQLLGYLFSGGLPPAVPFPDCGGDPTPADGVSCNGSPNCP